MIERVRTLRKEHIAHLLRAAASITGQDSFVIVGTGAVIGRLKNVPFALMQTREIDIYAADAEDPDTVSTLIDGTIGEGSVFDETFGYYAHGVGERTACMPADWPARAETLSFPEQPGLHLICPDPNDVALSKLCAWREKDRQWLVQALGHGTIGLSLMKERAPAISNPNAPEATEVQRRLDWLRAAVDDRGEGSRAD